MHSATPLCFWPPFKSFEIQTDTSQSCTYIIDYEYKYTSYFTSILFIVKPLERKINIFVSTDHWIFFLIFCIVIPRREYFINRHLPHLF